MTTLLILSGFYIIWLAALLTVAYTPRLFHNYTLFKAINSILFVVISVAALRCSFRHEYIPAVTHCVLFGRLW